jgi:hypothetical protein
MDDLDDLSQRVRNLEMSLSSIMGIEKVGNLVIDVFLQKAHALKKIDAKRDDVINCQNQKIANLEMRIKELEHANTRR